MDAGIITKSLKVSDVKVTDVFWSKRQHLIAETVLPYQEKMLRDDPEAVAGGVEKSGVVRNFTLAARAVAENAMGKGGFYGMVFQDSDAYKWLEGVAYSHVQYPDKTLEVAAERLIDLICASQWPDGYINTYFTLEHPERRWQNLQECHELYCAGHLFEAACAYYECVGSPRLLNAAMRFADHIASRFGSEEGKTRGIPGHEEVEIGLLLLYHTTGKEKYKDLARYFIDERGRDPAYFAKEQAARGWSHFSADKPDPKYNQSHATVYEMPDAVGHAVRANYLFTAMADLAACDDDRRLYDAAVRLWKSATCRRMYITGGFGSTCVGESYTVDRDLPNDTAYAETCASCAAVFFAKRLLLTERKAEYADVMERALYNGILSGMQLDGKRFFYVNPLEVNPDTSGIVPECRHVLPQRPGWYACACCPPNLARLVASLGRYAWDEGDATVYSHLFLGSTFKGTFADVSCESSLPWEGSAAYTISPHEAGREFEFCVRRPWYAKSAALKLNGEVLDAPLTDGGYWSIKRAWQPNDRIEITFPMEAHRVWANPGVRADSGCVALERGPLVYCLESADNSVPLEDAKLPRTAAIRKQPAAPSLPEETVMLSADALSCVPPGSGDSLYSDTPPAEKPVTLHLIPYYAWGNRGPGQMRVWIHEAAL